MASSHGRVMPMLVCASLDNTSGLALCPSRLARYRLTTFHNNPPDFDEADRTLCRVGVPEPDVVM
ncbi:hypothetical protein DPMN_185599 [Dreissena polymorpha]|uniref:Uncharacterized protein n=1 Tax=Dreissena polymorpha TaxID=45954 RepID=A0A9D4DKU1_DREPO|nr:hypothetical protein DPMN_185599 [Dreissena polymorpha]